MQINLYQHKIVLIQQTTHNDPTMGNFTFIQQSNMVSPKLEIANIHTTTQYGPTGGEFHIHATNLVWSHRSWELLAFIQHPNGPTKMGKSHIHITTQYGLTKVGNC